MNISIDGAFKQVVKEWKIDLNSPYKKLEAKFCISKMYNLFDVSKLNVYECKLHIEKVEDFVFAKFGITIKPELEKHL